MSDLTPTPAESSSGPPGQVGPYRLKSQLGAGGMGEVYRAFDARLDRSVAIKRVRASFTREGRERERFWREAKSIARLRHPAIVEVFDIVEEHDGGWIVMELIEGVTLQEAVCQGPLPVDQALGLFLELAGALAEAHGHGILHRDLKAENVMIDSHGGAKLLDFGLAHTLEEQGLSRLTAKDRILGTPEAMSPEQATGGTLDARSDLFSLGSLLYRTVTGASPFAADNPLHALQKVAFADFEDPRSLRSDLPEGLCRLLERLLQKDPAQRPQSAAQLEADLGELIRPGSSSASAPAMVHLPRRSAAGQMDTAAPGRRHESATLLEIPSTQDTVTTLGERRQITILQCEISRDAGSQEPQGALDPEEWIELKPRLDSLIASVLEAMDGSLGQTLDQGYLLYFGLPKAREDDARRAVYAA
ncbi:MAG: protein kinase, partial [Acidobacteriota bacterium]